MIIAVVEHTWVEQVQKDLQKAGGDMLISALGADIASQLEASHDVAYTALTTQDAFLAGRVAGTGEKMEGSVILGTDEGIAEAQFVATQEGVVVQPSEPN